MKRGFTLIELLTVISILLLLAAITVPAVNHMLERGKAVKCFANLKAMSQAVSVYVAENNGAFPMALIQDSDGSKGWDFCIDSEGTVSPGLIWEDYGVNRIVNCPSFKGDDNWQGEPHTGYNYNASYLGGMRTYIRGHLMRDTPSARIMQLSNPSKTALFGDGEYAAGANKFMRSPLPGLLDASFGGRHAGTQGFRHLGRTHVVFADGNVQSRRPVATPAQFENQIAEGTGFLSVDNSLYGGASIVD
jgi:prepilin-type N-terminal cleavage/methylation domain-containing protein/prepilin-type processing-associated H-X9-DG protein